MSTIERESDPRGSFQTHSDIGDHHLDVTVEQPPRERVLKSMGPRQTTGDDAFPTFNIRGISVAAVDLAFACDFLGCRAAGAHGEYVTVTGAHGVVESAYDERVRLAHCQALMVVPDGMPLVWLGRLLGFSSMGRVYGPELMEHIFADPQYRQLRHFFYGANQSVIARLNDKLRSRFGEYNLVGTYCPPMSPLGFVEREDVLARIRDLKPDFVWVGLSTPKQELWMQMHMPKIGSGIAIGVGAAFDLVSGTTVQAPRWIQRSGFEWLFRLAMEPRRLYRRYFFIVPKYLQYAVAELIAHHLARRNIGPTDAP
jgi:N-acetylglucosaminyldiphosphoundecaprenol N-acetyl-beta-D-mannosaminyltransferase